MRNDRHEWSAVEKIAAQIIEIQTADIPQKPIERLSIVPDPNEWGDTAPVQDEDDLFHPSCKHGLMNYKSGTSSTGKKWEGYFCTLEDRTLQCATIGMNGQPWRK